MGPCQSREEPGAAGAMGWGRRGWGGGPHPRLGREVSLQGIPSENDIAVEHPVMLPPSFFLKTQQKNTHNHVLPIL